MKSRMSRRAAPNVGRGAWLQSSVVHISLNQFFSASSMDGGATRVFLVLPPGLYLLYSFFEVAGGSSVVGFLTRIFLVPFCVSIRRIASLILSMIMHHILLCGVKCDN